MNGWMDGWMDGILFLIFTNDQPIFPGTRSFEFAHDLAVAAQELLRQSI